MDAVIGPPGSHGGFPDKCRRSVSPRQLGYQHRYLRPIHNLRPEATPTPPTAASLSASSAPPSCSCPNGGIARRTPALPRHGLQLSSKSVPKTFGCQSTISCNISRNILVSSSSSNSSSSGTEPQQGRDNLVYEQSHSSGGSGTTRGGGDSGGGSDKGDSSGSNAGDGDRPYALRLLLLFLGGTVVAVGTFLALETWGPVPSSIPLLGSAPDAHLDAAAPPATNGGVAAEATSGGSETVGGGGDISAGMQDNGVLDNAAGQRLKRLMREAFADLAEMRLRLEALEAAGAAAVEAEAAGEALVLPLEGFAVRPVSRALASGVRLRGNAQVSGSAARWRCRFSHS
ncbi:hypothetical protein Vafri_11287 [Volvox africanus]|nr:hypothetical protein Vafri_11287 [Volvox africanus]